MARRHEQRRSKRLSTYIDVKLCRKTGDVPARGTYLNADGMFLETNVPVERGAKVELRLALPDRELAVFGEDAQLRLVQPGGDVPVDVPGVVAFDVGAQAGQVGSRAPVHGPVAARHPAFEAAQDAPFEAEQQPLGSSPRRHQRLLSTTSGASTASSTRVMIVSGVTSSASAS